MNEYGEQNKFLLVLSSLLLFGFLLLVFIGGFALLMVQAVNKENRELTVPGTVTSVESVVEPTILWFGLHEAKCVYLTFEDGYTTRIENDSADYEAIAGCKVGDKAEINKTEVLSTADIWLSSKRGEVIETNYKDVRLVRAAPEDRTATTESGK